MVGLQLPELIGAKYRPIRQLGQGGMSTVYVVEHVRTGEQLALKVITFESTYGHEAIERFKREARASARIRSDHVVRVIDADVAPELNGAPYLVMDLLEGSNLEEAAGEIPQPGGAVVRWLRQVARALDKAHALGIIHRDIKPENLFLARREDGASIVKVLDFGIAKMTAESTGTTQSGQLLGTPLYMSPEQARGDGTAVSSASDLYALGLIAFRLLTGEAYWTASTVTGLIAQIIYEPMEPPTKRFPELGADFDAWFAKACHRDPAQRFRSGKELVEQLALALHISLSSLPADETPLAVSGGGSQEMNETPAFGVAAATLPSQPDFGSSTPRGARVLLKQTPQQRTSTPDVASPSPPNEGSGQAPVSPSSGPSVEAAPNVPTLNTASSTMNPALGGRTRGRRPAELAALVAGAAIALAIFVWLSGRRAPVSTENVGTSPSAVPATRVPGVPNGIAATTVPNGVTPASTTSTTSTTSASGAPAATPAASAAAQPAAAAPALAASAVSGRPALDTAADHPGPASSSHLHPGGPLTPAHADGVRKLHPPHLATDHRSVVPSSAHATSANPKASEPAPLPYDPLSDQK